MPGLHVLAVRNPNYWNNAATHLDGVKYLHIADENAELTRYRAGGLHITAVVPRGQFEWIKQNLASELHVSPQLNTYYYGFNLRRPPFPEQRRAASRPLAGDRSRAAREVRAESGRSAGLRLDPARCLQLHLAVVRLRRPATRRANRRSAQALR